MGPGWIQIVVIVLVVLVLFFGPKRIPEIAGAIGKSIKEFKKAGTGEDDKGDKDKDEPKT